jgi:hypothetical protein
MGLAFAAMVLNVVLGCLGDMKASDSFYCLEKGNSCD